MTNLSTCGYDIGTRKGRDQPTNHRRAPPGGTGEEDGNPTTRHTHTKEDTLSQLTLFGTDAANNIVPFTSRKAVEIHPVQMFVASLVMDLMTPEEFEKAMEFLTSDEE